MSVGDVQRIVQTSDILAERYNVETRGFDKQLAPRIEPEESDEVHVPLIRLKDGDLWKSL